MKEVCSEKVFVNLSKAFQNFLFFQILDCLNGKILRVDDFFFRDIGVAVQVVFNNRIVAIF